MCQLTVAQLQACVRFRSRGQSCGWSLNLERAIESLKHRSC
jgi:hypothetical protein